MNFIRVGKTLVNLDLVTEIDLDVTVFKDREKITGCVRLMVARPTDEGGDYITFSGAEADEARSAIQLAADVRTSI